MTLRVFENADALQREAARTFAAIAVSAVGAHRRCTVALSGGSTPRGLYELLGRQYAGSVPWAQIEFFWGDERHVPPDHPDSNYRMAWNALLAHVPVPSGHVHRMRGELPDAQHAAQDYEAVLRRVFGLTGNDLPRFDLALMGLGDDGHTASLFPGSDALRETQRLAVANPVPRLETVRITLTVPVFNHAAHVMFLVAGAGKAAALRNVIEGPRQPGRWPAQLIRPVQGELAWLVDEAAARLLDP